MFYYSVTTVINELCKDSLYHVDYYYYLLGILCNMTYNYTHWEPCNYSVQDSYKIKVFCVFYLPYIADADSKAYSKMSCDCSPHIPYWRILPFIIFESCKCPSLNSHRRKVLCSFYITYVGDTDYKSYLEMSCDIYYSLIYFFECPNIFKFHINLVNQTILIKLTTYLCKIRTHV